MISRCEGVSIHKIIVRFAPEKINKFECAFAYKGCLKYYVEANLNIFGDVSQKVE